MKSRWTKILKKTTGNGPDGTYNPDSPEAQVANNIKAFVEFPSPDDVTDKKKEKKKGLFKRGNSPKRDEEPTSQPDQDGETVYLVEIVELAVSSPAAAQRCAQLVHEYLKGTNINYQYKSLGLIPILVANPGATFTRNLDSEFTETVKLLLKGKKTDPKVLHMAIQVLNELDQKENKKLRDGKPRDEELTPLLEMYKKERDFYTTLGQAPIQRYLHTQPQQPQQQQQLYGPGQMGYPGSETGLPGGMELERRIEEAKNSAGLLQDAITNTPPGEFFENELLDEFAKRCNSASDSLQGYMTRGDSALSETIMLDLINTNEHLQSTLNLYRRALLSARKHAASLTTGGGDGDRMDVRESTANGDGFSHSRQPSPGGAGLGINMASGAGSSRQPAPPPRTNGKGKGREYEPQPQPQPQQPLTFAGSSGNPSREPSPVTDDDPFRDPDEPKGSRPAAAAAAGGGSSNRYFDQEPRLAFEPFHPGFDTTPSYTGRQESAIGKEAMHGAVGNTSTGKSTDKTTQQYVSDDDDDVYDVSSSKQKEPMYRY